jgi:hypothetical protein
VQENPDYIPAFIPLCEWVSRRQALALHKFKEEAVTSTCGAPPSHRYAHSNVISTQALAELWIHSAILQVGESSLGWGFDFHFQVLRKAEK